VTTQARRVTLGRVAGVFGIRGWVKVQSYTRPAENLLDYPRWWLLTAQAYETKLIEGRVHGAGLVAQISDASGKPIEDRDIAAALIGTEIQVERSELPKAPRGSYYWADLVGLEVFSADDQPLGQVTGLMENGVQDVLVLKDAAGQERLIPFVPGPIIQSVDLAAKRIVADWAPDY
jgi:16S rRNA processing protein RimM